MEKEYGLIVIGTGSAGATAAHICRSAGRSVAIIDNRPFGGTCALRGCDPKKILVGAAEIIDRSMVMKEKGIVKEIAINWPELMKFKKTFTEPVAQNREKGYEQAGIDMFHGTARFVDKNSLEVGNTVLSGKHIVIATGAKPMKLGMPGEEHITTSDGFLEMGKLPESIIFIGGGYISFEFAHIASRAGAKVKILHRSQIQLKKFDHDLVDALMQASREIGIDVYLNTTPDSVEKKGQSLVVRAGEEVFQADMVVHGGGRVPDIDELDLEKGEIAFDKKRRCR